MLNQELIDSFAELVIDQASGDPRAIERLRGLRISLSNGYCIRNLYEQWLGAFSYSPGRVEALQPIATLARKLQSFSQDDPLELYYQPEWTQLIELRGPVEVVLMYRCGTCRREYVSMGTSGFYDANGLVCPKCGNVYFKAYGDDSKTPPCSCGANFPSSDKYGCPSCGNADAKLVKQISPFEYFHNHTYCRGPDA